MSVALFRPHAVLNFRFSNIVSATQNLHEHYFGSFLNLRSIHERVAAYVLCVVLSGRKNQATVTALEIFGPLPVDKQTSLRVNPTGGTERLPEKQNQKRGS